MQAGLIWVADYVPPLAFVAALVRLLWGYFMLDNYKVQLFDVVLPFIVLLIVLMILHVLIALVLPLRWPAIRGEFQRQLERRLRSDLESAYAAIPA